MLDIACPNCSRVFRFKSSQLGKRARCKCGTVFPVGPQSRAKSHTHQHAEQTSATNAGLKADDYRLEHEQDILIGSVVVFAILAFGILALNFVVFIVLVVFAIVVVKWRQANLLGSAVKVTERQFPKVHQCVKIAAERLNHPEVDVFVKQHPVINAIAMGWLDKQTIVLHSATVEAMDEEELTAIIGHELSHIKCKHTTWSVFTTSTSVNIPIISHVLSGLFLWWSRACEYTCDRAGVIASRNPRAVVQAMVKIAVGRELYDQVDIDHLFEQQRTLDQDDMAKFGELLHTHPHTLKRIRAIEQFGSSDLYRKLTGTA